MARPPLYVIDGSGSQEKRLVLVRQHLMHFRLCEFDGSFEVGSSGKYNGVDQQQGAISPGSRPVLQVIAASLSKTKVVTTRNHPR